MIKNILAIMCGIVFSLGTAHAKPFVFACEPEWEFIAKEIGGDQIRTVSATHGLQNPHFIRVKPSLMSKIKKADLLICSGADLEVGWLPLLLRNGNKSIQAGQIGHLLVSDYVDNIEIPEVLDRSMGDIHPGGNPHIHLDPEIISKTASMVASRLSLIDPENRQIYVKNLDSFESNWRSAMARWKTAGKSLAGKRVVVHHKSFSYLLNFLEIETLTSLEDKAGIPPSARHLSEIVTVIEGSSAIAIIRTPFDPKSAGDWVSDKTGIPVVTLPFTVGGSPEATDLYKVYDASIQLLLQ
ncbi:MAG: zinc ABC transporter solute-binding protein [Betaproteobacteria bacterium]|nr:zinc ABC transporter solute-binding protein [Betaproteobacteria bacterium]